MSADPALRRAFRSGAIDSLPFLLVITPFGLLFGVVATEAGLNLVETMSMTILVVAGASQFVAVQMMADHAPAMIVLVTSLAVNLRMAMYSATLTPHLGAAPLWQRALISYLLVDQVFALAAQKYEAEPKRPLPQKLAYVFGTTAIIVPPWYVTTYLGATLGQAIPPEYALDFAVPITFLAMIAPMLRSLPHAVTAAVSVAAALALVWMPHNTGLLVASVLAMMAGARAELWLARRRLDLGGKGGAQ